MGSLLSKKTSTPPSSYIVYRPEKWESSFTPKVSPAPPRPEYDPYK